MMFSKLSAKRVLMLMMFVSMFSIAACTDTDTDTSKVKNQAPDFSISANKLFAEYKANEVAADAKYKGKIILVTGKIHDIGKDIMDQAYIVIGGTGFIDGVQCTFTKSENNTIAALSKGAVVSVKGEAAGKMGNVMINKSSLQ